MPSSQFRSEYIRYDVHTAAGRAHDLFQRRLEVTRFDAGYFSQLEAALEQAAALNPADPDLAYELAFVLVQYRPTVARLARARGLLATLSADTPPPDARVARLLELVAMMEDNARRNAACFRLGRVNWAINNVCPMVCKGCYNPFTSRQLSLAQALEVVDKLASHGTTALMLSGGDPLLWEPIHTFLAAARVRGLELGLDTTGYGLSEDVARGLRATVSSLGLPLDGSTNQIQRAFRRSVDPDLVGALEDALTTCDRVRFPHVRLHTVVNAHNIDDVAEIARIARRHPCVRQWALFQWWDRRASRRMSATMSVDDDALAAVVARATEAAPGIEVLGYPAKRREMTNLFVQSSGQVLTFGSGPAEEFIIGNILDDDVDALLSSPAVNQSALIRNLVGHGYETASEG
jgi:Radical SAM superfamily/4Fe-4S single cluster domain